MNTQMNRIRKKTQIVVQIKSPRLISPRTMCGLP
jgi:hypothetical protein